MRYEYKSKDIPITRLDVEVTYFVDRSCDRDKQRVSERERERKKEITAMGGSRIYDHSLLSYNMRNQEVSLSLMTLLYQELIQHEYKQSDSIEQFQYKLARTGYRLGVNILELVNYRSSVPQPILNKFKDSSSSSSSSATTATTVAAATTSRATNMSKENGVATTNAYGSNNMVTSIISTNGGGGSGGSGSGSGGNTAVATSTPQHINNVSNIEDKEYVSIGKDIPKMKRRDLKIIDTLQFIHGTVWSYLFGHVSNDLMKSQENDTEYRIVDNEPQWTQFISSSKRNQVHYESCNYMLCGLIQGYLCESGFPCAVTAHWQPTDQYPQRIVFVIQFQQDVVTREQLRYTARG